MKASKPAIAAVVLTACCMPMLQAAELQSDTLNAWTLYVKNADRRMQERVARGLPFLWSDEAPDRAAHVWRGDVVVAPAVGDGAQGVPSGLVHDWIGAVFVPGGTIDGLWAVMHDYDNYQHMYRPVVASSRTLACTDTSQEFQMVWRRKVLFVSTVMEGHYRATDFVLDAHRGYNVAETLEVQEIERYGRTGEQLLPPGTGSGFIWRVRSVARYEERDGGVYLELEGMALTRDIPASLAWMVNPVINHLAINSLTATLRQTRDAVLSPRRLDALTSCRISFRGSYMAKTGGE